MNNMINVVEIAIMARNIPIPNTIDDPFWSGISLVVSFYSLEIIDEFYSIISIVILI
jgi:hypothetical protein